MEFQDSLSLLIGVSVPEQTKEKQMKFMGIDNIGSIVKDTDTYVVKDQVCEDMVVSSTLLYPGKKTGGHKHDDQEEVYFFIKGNGRIIIDEEYATPVQSGNVCFIEKGEHHQVLNEGNEDKYFICMFPGKREH